MRCPRAFGTLSGIRPPNHPQRRLALAAHWLAKGNSGKSNLPQKLEKWLERQIESPDLLTSVSEILEVGHDAFWSYHSTFRSTPARQAQQLLGEQRVTDIAIT